MVLQHNFLFSYFPAKANYSSQKFWIPLDQIKFFHRKEAYEVLHGTFFIWIQVFFLHIESYYTNKWIDWKSYTLIKKIHLLKSADSSVEPCNI